MLTSSLLQLCRCLNLLKQKSVPRVKAWVDEVSGYRDRHIGIPSFSYNTPGNCYLTCLSAFVAFAYKYGGLLDFELLEYLIYWPSSYYRFRPLIATAGPQGIDYRNSPNYCLMKFRFKVVIEDNFI